MPKYKANAYLVHKGQIVQSGQEVELEEELAERLGEKVTLVEVEEALEPDPEAPKVDTKKKKK